nr:hypothetical protein [Candidatus Sigynarchaeota archaeon]
MDGEITIDGDFILDGEYFVKRTGVDEFKKQLAMKIDEANKKINQEH